MRYVFTGPTKLSVEQRRYCVEALGNMPFADEYVTGGAEGLDVLAAACMMQLYPEARHIIMVPRGVPYDLPNVNKLAKAGANVQVAPGGSEPYRQRNRAMFTPLAVDQELQAFVYRDTFYRSGEWMTINIARRLGIPFNLYPLPAEEAT